MSTTITSVNSNYYLHHVNKIIIFCNKSCGANADTKVIKTHFSHKLKIREHTVTRQMYVGLSISHHHCPNVPVLLKLYVNNLE